MKVLLVYELIPESTKFYVFEDIDASSELYANLVDANGHYSNYVGDAGDNEGTEFLDTYLDGVKGIDVADLPETGPFDIVIHSGFGL